jgi:hypothetical protein
MWGVVHTIGWFLVSAGFFSIMWFAPGAGRALLSRDVPWPAAIMLCYVIGCTTLAVVSLGVICLVILLKRIQGADWRFTRRFEEMVLPLEMNHRCAVLAFQAAVVVFALYHIATM